MIKKRYLQSPGPTPVPEEVQAAGAQSLIHHRTQEFSQIFMQATAGLKYVFQTEQDVYILTASGSGAMEAAVVNILSPGEKAISLNSGKFGARWGHICRTYGVNLHEVVLEWGEPFSPEQLAEQLKSHPDTKAVLATLSETSTGTIYDIQGFSEITSATDTLLVVDGISGIGAMPCPMDQWHIDVLISGSQKSFMIPPGLSFIAFSEKAWQSVLRSRIPKFYFDAKAARKSLEKQTSPWTPGITLIMQLHKALNIIKKMGLPEMFEHHRILGKATRAAVKALDLKLLSKNPGNILTAVKVPAGIDGKKIVSTMQNKYKVHIAGAQEPHKGEFFRIGHLGYIGGFDIITTLSALEMTLSELGYVFNEGQAVIAAHEIIKEKWQ